VILGVISDVHANVLALEAALEALRKRGAEQVICLGDLVGYGPSPNETLDLIRSEGVICTLGAADERIAFDFTGTRRPRKGVADQILQWTREVVKPEHIEFLRSLPVQQRLETPAGRLRFFHGGPDTPEQRINLDQDPMSLMRLLEQNRSSIIAAGSTHVPFYRKVANGWVVNPGSVGLALNGEPGADYALLTIRENSVELHMDKVEYDFAAVAFDIIAWGLPQVVAEAVQRGRMPAAEASPAAEGDD
jgi:putative phosphoesterase